MLYCPLFEKDSAIAAFEALTRTVSVKESADIIRLGFFYRDDQRPMLVKGKSQRWIYSYSGNREVSFITDQTAHKLMDLGYAKVHRSLDETDEDVILELELSCHQIAGGKKVVTDLFRDLKATDKVPLVFEAGGIRNRVLVPNLTPEFDG